MTAKSARSLDLLGKVLALSFLSKELGFFLLQWRYSIRIENMIGEQVQLRERHWSIYSLTGTMETVRGRGVVGQVRRNS